MSDTTRLQLPLIAAAQAQKHVTHNEAIMRLDGLLQMTAKSYTTSAQPSLPSDGDLYLCPAGKTGTDWGGYSNHAVAHYYDGIWHQYHPNQGWLCYVQDTNTLFYYTGSLWAFVPATGMADGTVSAPGLPFSSDADTGVYRIGANNLGIAVGGTKALDAKTTGVALLGTNTNDSAASGFIGEYLESVILSGSAVSLTSNVAKDITSLSLPAGDWDVGGTVITNPAGSTVITNSSGWVNSASATFPTRPNGGALWENNQSHSAGQGDTQPLGSKRVSLASTTTFYLSCQIVFTTSTCSAYGIIWARRRR